MIFSRRYKLLDCRENNYFVIIAIVHIEEVFSTESFCVPVWKGYISSCSRQRWNCFMQAIWRKVSACI